MLNGKKINLMLKSLQILKLMDFDFEQTSKSINFEVNEKNKIFTIILPEELLLVGPYLVLLDDEKIHYHSTNK